MKTYHIIGLMSGTSLDGLDLCYVSFTYPDYDFQIIHTETFSYDETWKERLTNSIHLTSEELYQLHSEYGYYLGEKVNHFCKKYEIQNVDAISSHGHTVFHNPTNKYTLQIGHGAAIAAVAKYKVVCDFRTQDVIFGGQGAPLVPIGDQLLFSRFDACLNLGGFSNISFEKNSKRIAFDICPVNTILNLLAQKEGLEYDKDGTMAQKGIPNPVLLEKLNQLDYYFSSPPKSLGIEWSVKNILPLLNENKESTENLSATFTRHITDQIAKTINDNNLKSVLVTGGGTKNNFLMKTIQSLTSAKIIIPDNQLIDFKEALIFAFLGMLRLENQTNILSSVTGAYKDHSSGIMYFP